MPKQFSGIGPVFLPDPVNKEHPLNQGRVAWYICADGLDGSQFFYDLINSNNAKLINGATVKGLPFRQGGTAAISFDGTKDFATVTNNAKLNLGSTGTISCWFYNLNNTGFRILIWKGTSTSDSSANYGLYYSAISSGIVGVISNGSTNSRPTVSLTPATGSWHHAALTWTTAGAILYIDGILATVGAAVTAVSNSADLHFGSELGAADFFQGSIDDISIWNRSLSAKEIYDVYQQAFADYPTLNHDSGLTHLFFRGASTSTSTINNTSGFIWNILSNINNSQKYIWNDSFLCNNIRKLVWNTYYCTNAAEQLIWKILSNINNTDRLIWSSLSNVNNTKQYIWNTTNPTNVSKSLIWNIFDSVNSAQTISLIWNTLSPQNKSSLLLWNTFSCLNKLEQLVWNDLAACNNSNQELWNVYAKINNSSGMLWNVASLVNAIDRLIWNVASFATVNNNTRLVWNTLYNINNFSKEIWNTASRLNKSEVFIWNMLVSLNKSEQFIWNDASLVNNNLKEIWNVLGQAAGSQEQFVWNVLEKLNYNESLIWNMTQSINNQQQLIWDTIGQATNSTEFLWNLLETINPDAFLNLKWDTLEKLDVSCQELWKVYSLLSNEEKLIWHANWYPHYRYRYIYNLIMALQEEKDLKLFLQKQKELKCFLVRENPDEQC